jgi:hypothetical protein
MTNKAISQLRRRLIQDMAIRRLGPKTQHHYIRHVTMAAFATRRRAANSGVACPLALSGARRRASFVFTLMKPSAPPSAKSLPNSPRPARPGACGCGSARRRSNSRCKCYEAEFLGFSYGFRPGRGQHDALDALAYGIGARKINWILDADIRSFLEGTA